MPKLFTVSLLASLFSRSDNTIRGWIADGVFPRAFKVKDGWYVPEADVKKIMSLSPDQVIPGLEHRPKVPKSPGK